MTFRSQFLTVATGREDLVMVDDGIPDEASKKIVVGEDDQPAGQGFPDRPPRPTEDTAPDPSTEDGSPFPTSDDPAPSELVRAEGINSGEADPELEIVEPKESSVVAGDSDLGLLEQVADAVGDLWDDASGAPAGPA